MSLKKVVACIKRYNNFLVTAHTNLEGDALGSELAFYRLLKKLGKKAIIINEDSLPTGYNFLPGKEKIKRLKDILRKKTKFDCFVALDCSDLKRTGQVYRINRNNKPVLNIDHHISNRRFGDVNWIEPYSSSCSEMIYKLYKKLRLPFDRDTAICIYVGMLTDTASFRYSNTGSATHKAVAELLRYELDVPLIYKNTYENIPFGDMKLLSRILTRIKRDAGGRVIWFQIEKRLLRKTKLSFDLTDHILSFARAIKDVEVVVLFKENLSTRNEVRVNLRSQGRVDVNRIASFFGGGGHRTASGATIHGKINEVRKKVLAKIRESLG